jgi:hypothetical protein
MRKWLILFCSLWAWNARADDMDAYLDNLCHEQAAWEKIEALHKQVPNDMIVARGYALRVGICKLVDEKKISLEQGMKLFDIERQRMIMERAAEDERKKNPRPVPLEEIEPEV